VRVLILSTPFDARARLDGSRCAVADLAHALASHGVDPTVLVRAGEPAPRGARTFLVRGNDRLEAALAASLADVDLIHAWFAPRLPTATVLRAVRRARGIPIVQTVASIPRSMFSVASTLAGDVVVPTSDATAIALATAGIDARNMAKIPSPFAHQTDVVAEPGAPRDLLLYAGDWEFDDGIMRTLQAFARMSPPRGVNPHLAIAARAKTDKAKEIEDKVKKRIAETVALRQRVTILGEVPSLLPWIAASRGVIVPASTTFAKLDHPRVLLEAIALGVRVVVGTAPSLAELVDDPRVGEVASDSGELREALEKCFSEPPPPANAILKILAPRRPESVAKRYAELYRSVIDRRR
jgi:glycosyltransferase involved in cell wall biosynthesis